MHPFRWVLTSHALPLEGSAVGLLITIDHVCEINRFVLYCLLLAAFHVLLLFALRVRGRNLRTDETCVGVRAFVGLRVIRTSPRRKRL